MTTEVLASARKNLRGTDSNSLLRLYDLAKDLFGRSPSAEERGDAGRAVQRVAKELQRRGVSF